MMRRYSRCRFVKFLSTPSARRATSNSLHVRSAKNISIHALREEGDQAGAVASKPKGVFLSTPSARRATSAHLRPGPAGCISIHALREEGDALGLGLRPREIISIHALREEGDRR